MPSHASQYWFTVRAASLDEIENAHRAVGGGGPGRRYATQQLNYAYAMLLSGQFQGYCRDFHTECVAGLVSTVVPAPLRATLRTEFEFNRKVDRGNPTPGNLGSDFNRLGLDFWVGIGEADARNSLRRQALDELNAWRNAIAHQDFTGFGEGTGLPALPLARVRSWRAACDGLVRSFDGVMNHFLLEVTGIVPW